MSPFEPLYLEEMLPVKVVILQSNASKGFKKQKECFVKNVNKGTNITKK